MNFDKNRKNIITGIENQMEILQGEYDLLSDKLHEIALKIKSLNESITPYSNFEYKGYGVVVLYDDIKHRSIIKAYQDKLYITINNKLTSEEAEYELIYAISNMLPGVIEQINIKAAQEQEEEQKYQEELKQLQFNHIDYGDVQTVYKNLIINFNGIHKICDIVKGFVNDSNINNTITSNVLYELGVIEGKRAERERRKGVTKCDTLGGTQEISSKRKGGK